MCNPAMDDDDAASAAKSAKAEATESWIVKRSPDPCCLDDDDDEDGASAKRRTRRGEIVDASCDVRSVVFGNDAAAFEAFRAGGRTARVALADLAARAILEALDEDEDDEDDDGAAEVRLETLDRRSRPADATTRTGRRRSARRRRRRRVDHHDPFVVERSDVRCDDDHRLRATLRARGGSADDDVVVALLSERVVPTLRSRALAHVACAVLQDRLREALEGADAVAFVGDGSILPRRSGADQRPLPADEAVPTEAPPSLRRALEVRLGGGLARHLEVGDGAAVSVSPDGAVASVTGLVVPAGVTLLVGGGYHGKSTLLRAIAAGATNKIPGDGRELCVARRSAVSVRAEDGRYVSDCDLRPFLNLDTLPGRRPERKDASSAERRFSTSDASGSTSQAAAVVEALEAGATALLLDEDVSAANFLARDGRMRALVRDETITPLLYRVNGMYRTLGVSTVVVVGGVGDWLDVAEHAVLRLDGYRLRDASAEARSVSRTFSHHHVQYGGRGVVHRLDWDDRLTPRQRRPVTTTATKDDDKGWTVSVEGGRLYVTRDDDDDDDDDDGGIDLDRCEQLLVAKAGSPAELRGVGLCVARLLEIARDRPTLGTRALLAALDEDLDREPSFLRGRCAERGTVAYRPRAFEVAAALVRRRGTRFAPAPDDDGAATRDEARRAADAEADRARRELLAAWNDRRRGRNFNEQFR